MFKQCIIVSLLTLICPSVTHGQAYVFQGADYSYLHSPWFVIDECTYADGCEFKLDGVLAVQHGAKGSLDFVVTELELTGNEDLVDHPFLEQTPTTGSRVADLLRDTTLTLRSDDGATKVFVWDRGNFELTVNQDILRLSGGYDLRPADGDGVFFDATGRRTWIGDANLNLKFDSGDLVQVFAAGLFDDGISENGTWSTGDWNGDREFDSADLVAAFEEGGYGQGEWLRANRIPEPASSISWIVGIIGITIAGRRRTQPTGWHRH